MLGALIAWVLVGLLIAFIVVFAIRMSKVVSNYGWGIRKHPFAMVRLAFGRFTGVSPQTTISRLRRRSTHCRLVLPTGKAAAATDIDFTISEADFALLRGYIALDELEHYLSRAYGEYVVKTDMARPPRPTEVKITSSSNMVPGMMEMDFHRGKSFHIPDPGNEKTLVVTQKLPADSAASASNAQNDDVTVPTGTAELEFEGHDSETGALLGELHLEYNSVTSSIRAFKLASDPDYHLKLLSYGVTRQFPSGGFVWVGRGTDADIGVTDPRVSRKHFALSFDGSSWVISPSSDASNGVFLNDSRAALESKKILPVGETTVSLGRRVSLTLNVPS